MSISDQNIKLLRRQGVYLSPNTSFHAKTVLECEVPVALSASSVHMSGRIGAYTYMRNDGRLANRLKSIGRYCSIAPNVTIGDSNHPIDWLSTNPFQYGNSSLFNRYHADQEFEFMQFKTPRSATHIGHDVWIGGNVMILQNVRIGHGAIIAAGSIVTKDVPPYAIVGGVPAKVIRYRFPEDVIAKLLALEWWNYQADSLIGIQFDQVEVAIEQIKEKAAAGQLKLIDPNNIVKVVVKDLLGD